MNTKAATTTESTQNSQDIEDILDDAGEIIASLAGTNDSVNGILNLLDMAGNQALGDFEDIGKDIYYWFEQVASKLGDVAGAGPSTLVERAGLSVYNMAEANIISFHSSTGTQWQKQIVAQFSDLQSKLKTLGEIGSPPILNPHTCKRFSSAVGFASNAASNTDPIFLAVLQGLRKNGNQASKQKYRLVAFGMQDVLN